MKKLLSKIGLHRIRLKLFAMILAVMILFFILISVFSSPALFMVLSHQTYRNLSSAAEEIDNCIPGTATYYFELFSIAQNNNIEFEIIDAGGMLAYTSQGSSAESSNHFPFSGSSGSQYSNTVATESYSYAVRQENFEIRQKIATSAEYFVLTFTLENGETLYVYSSVADIENIVDVADSVFTFICILIVLIISFVFYLLVGKFTKPLVEMNDITKDMAALNFERRLRNYGKDEIGELGKSINTLSSALDETLIDLKDKNKQLEKDIERRHALDNARTSFINNVSHELKTPIAIISGYAEGLCEGISNDPEVIRDYCSIIKEESHKMNSLVVELLELSKLESKGQPFVPSKFDVCATVDSILNHLALEFEKSGITVRNTIEGPLECYAQDDKIEIVLKNYITNAVSHCSGDKIIEISAKDIGNKYEISVFNTGEHIADNDLPEIWDSFYRADKAHARNENRFGLGLSIVKSIMTNHNCGYSAENVEGGVIFRFEVPKDSDYYDEKTTN